MWKLENHEGVKYWYEGELIEKIKSICKEQTETRMLFADNKSFCDFNKILKLIAEYERKER